MTTNERRRQRVLLISFSDLTLDARIQRQVRFLESDYELVVAAVGRPLAGVEFHELRQSNHGPAARALESAVRIAGRAAGRYRQTYWFSQQLQQWRRDLLAVDAVDVIIVNDLWGVPLALSISDGVPVIFDSHEHWTSESASWTLRQRLSMRGAHEWIVDHEVPRTAAVMTVSPGIAREYQTRAGIDPTLVTNAPFAEDLAPSPVSTPIKLLHVGRADERRRLEDTIDVVSSLGDRFTLDLFLAHDSRYRRRLAQMASRNDHIRVLSPIPRSKLIVASNAYDVGVFFLPARFPNQVHVLPNKLFDYIQARLAVAIGPSPEMATVVREWGCGVVSESFSPASFATALEGLTATDVERMKDRSDRAARVLTAETNRDVVLAMVRRALESHPRPFSLARQE